MARQQLQKAAILSGSHVTSTGMMLNKGNDPSKKP